MGGSQDNRISEGCLEQVLGICPRHADVRLAEFAWQMLNEMFAGMPYPLKLPCSGKSPVETPWRASCLACRTRAVLYLSQGACACQWDHVIHVMPGFSDMASAMPATPRIGKDKKNPPEPPKWASSLSCHLLCPRLHGLAAAALSSLPAWSCQYILEMVR